MRRRHRHRHDGHERRQAPTPLARSAHAIFEDASRLGYGKEDDAAVIKVYQALTGITLPKREDR